MEEALKDRARSLLARLAFVPPHKVAPSSRARLLKLVRSELRFLDRGAHAAADLSSTNLGYLEAVVQVLQHPLVDAASAVLQTFAASPAVGIARTKETDGKLAEVHVDVVCTFQAKPVWIVVSDRNPKYLNWLDEGTRTIGWRSRVQLLLNVALASDFLKPKAVLFFFAKGASSSLVEGFETEFGASRTQTFGYDHELVAQIPVQMFRELEDGEWVDIQLSKHHFGPEIGSQSPRCTSSERCTTLEVSIDATIMAHRDVSNANEHQRAESKGLGSIMTGDHALPSIQIVDQSLDAFPARPGEDRDETFSFFLATLRLLKNPFGEEANGLSTSNLVNLDTTALVALVSEASNGAASMLVTMSDQELLSKFGNTARFMRDQAEAELKSPLLQEMTRLLADKRPFISESVFREFKSLVSLCGSSQERHRADALLKLLPVLPDAPSFRMMGLCETGKIKEKNKIVFGTGDYLQAPTLTANLSFVRAVRQTGMALSVIEHEPRALVGSKM